MARRVIKKGDILKALLQTFSALLLEFFLGVVDGFEEDFCSIILKSRCKNTWWEDNLSG